jgi:signal transduction histidine kinase
LINAAGDAGAGRVADNQGFKNQRCQVLIQVIDNGPGIPDKFLPRIFEPFFTTKGTARKGEAKGTGLGLAICKEIVEHHKGRLEVESEVGQGSTFTIVLPVGQ